ncbi:hypothetical protein KBB05_05680 [Patescibacteria group bacterium]|nr:hypothetical protein [Patescibacteria group bacterium]
MTQWLKDNGHPSFRKKQIYTEIFHNSIIRFDEMSTLPLAMREELSTAFQIIPYDIDSIHEHPESTKV